MFHLLSDKGSTDGIATRALVLHDGGLYVHCLSTEREDGMPEKGSTVIPLLPEGGSGKDERSRREDSVITEDSIMTDTSSVRAQDILNRPLPNSAITPAAQVSK